ncbi:MAG: response regulator [Gammaproteobacteria bacterium]|jgi:two-component system, chemotaxis family, chemotaxis protein CheY
MAKTILVVDDSASLRQVVSLTLKRAGYEVMEAGDGREALGKLDGVRVNLIVSDVNMPNMDGIAMVQEIRKDPKNRFTPIIMLTTESQDAVKQKGKEAGVKAWMVKPFKPDQMLNAVSKLVAP